MRGFRNGNRWKDRSSRLKFKEVSSIYGPVFWELKPSPRLPRKPRKTLSPLLRPLSRPRRYPSPVREVQEPLAVLSHSAVVKRSPLPEPPEVQKPVRSVHPANHQRSFTPDIRPQLQLFVQTKSKSSYRMQRVVKKSESGENNPSPWFVSAAEGASPLAVRDQERS